MNLIFFEKNTKKKMELKNLKIVNLFFRTVEVLFFIKNFF